MTKMTEIIPLEPVMPDSATPQADSKTKAAQAIECFTPGTLIVTREGPVSVENLRRGDMILTRDNGFQPLIWKGARRERFSEGQARPVVIEKDALGPGQPERATIVSPNHKILCPTRLVAYAQPEPEILVEAQSLAGTIPGVSFVDARKLNYVNLLMENHEIVLANGAWMESFRLSRPAAAILRAARCAPVLRAFPGLNDDAEAELQVPARCILPNLLGFEATRLA